MAHEVRERSEIPVQDTWDMDSVFPSVEAWEAAYNGVEAAIPGLVEYAGRLGEGPALLVEWLERSESVSQTLGKLYVYASSKYNVDTNDGDAQSRNDRAAGLGARVAAAVAFEEPEILAVGLTTLRQWMKDEPRLATYDHYFERLENQREHIRSTEVEEVLGLVAAPFAGGSRIHSVLTDTDMTFQPARGESGEAIDVAQGNIAALLTDSDREIRRTAWENYADAHLAVKNTLATCLSTGVKQQVFAARVRRYNSALEAALVSTDIPVVVFDTLIDTYRRNLPIWHRYWAIRRRVLGNATLREYDTRAPLTANPPQVPFRQAIDWIVEGMRPLGDEYVQIMQRGIVEERWVDIYPNRGKRSGAYSTGTYGTHPFILMSYNDDLFSMSTLAHELGHSMHSYYTRHSQPYIYSRYGLFVAEVASNFNQALVRAHLLEANADPDFQIAVIEEAMANFHRYFFIMPTLARFELEIHRRIEAGGALNSASLNELMAQLLSEGYGGEVEMDVERSGVTWAQFPIHLYLNFYVYQYATGIAAAHALAQGVLSRGSDASERYLTFLQSGGSVYPLDALRAAGVDMTSPEPVEQAFSVMAGLVDRLDTIVSRTS